jgi:hypothetical protein
MADEHIQRAYRASQTPAHNAPEPEQASASSGDPLAELARLIGQNDPFAEYGHDGRGGPQAGTGPAAYQTSLTARDMHAASARAYAEAPAYDDPRYEAPFAQAAFPPPAAPPPSAHYARPDYDDAAYGSQDAQGIVAVEPVVYEEGGFYPNNPHAGADDEHFYDDVPPRRRVGVLAIAAVFALAVVGTAGAFGYRTLFGSSSADPGPPPVIKADASPSKVVPAAQSKDPQSGKLIYDRVNNSQNEKVVSREEQPLDVNNRSAGSVLPQIQNNDVNGAGPPAASGSGVVGVEPKKIHTIAIRPSDIGNPNQAPTANAVPPPARAEPAAPPPSPRRTVESPPPRQAARNEPAVQRPAAAPSPGNAPLSLNPDAVAAPAQRPMRTASAPASAAAAPTRTAAPTPIAPVANGNGGYAVQIVARHSEADAHASFQSLQAKYPQQLGGKAPLIRRVDLGAKGVYYRAMVGPFGSSDQASQLCANLKAAGGDCIVQKI